MITAFAEPSLWQGLHLPFIFTISFNPRRSSPGHAEFSLIYR